MRCLLVLALLALSSAAAAQIKRVDPDDVRCALVRTPQPVDFRGRRLVEIPDVTDPELRRANLLLSSGCFEEAVALLEDFVAAHGAGPAAAYVAARATWIGGTTEAAAAFVDEALREFPDFVSLQVLRAGLRFDASRDGLDVAAILDRVEPQAPDDMWVYVYRLRVEALTRPSDEVRETLLEIVGDPRFPPNVRDIAAIQSRRTRYAAPGDFDAAYRAQLTYTSSIHLGCKLTEYAVWLMEIEGRFADARRLLDPYADSPDACSIKGSKPRMLLAYANLVAAADIASQPTAANAQFVDRAHQLLRGNYVELASWLQSRPQEARLRPFMQPHIEVDKVDKYGRTTLCNAIMLVNVGTVQAELERGANPDGRCGGFSLADYVVMQFDETKRTAERTSILRLLLQHGAKPDVGPCKNHVQCRTYLLPIFQEYGLGR